MSQPGKGWRWFDRHPSVVAVEDGKRDGAPTELDKAFNAAFNNPAGRAVMRHLKAVIVDEARFIPGEDPHAGLYREGMAETVRYLERRLKRANALQRKQSKQDR